MSGISGIATPVLAAAPPAPPLADQLRAQTAESIQSWISKSDTVQCVERWFLAFGKTNRSTIRAKALLALVMMHLDADSIFDSSAVDRVMRDEAAALFVATTEALDGGDFEEFWSRFVRAHGLFCAWKARDRPKTLKYLLDEAVMVRARQARDKLPFTPPEELFQQARAVGGVAAEHAARQRYDKAWQAVKPDDFESHVVATFERAFWDGLKEEVVGGSYDRLFDSIDELKQAMQALVAHSDEMRRDIDEHVDVALMRQQAQHAVLDAELVHGTVSWIAKCIHLMQAAADDAEVGAWRGAVDARIESSKSLSLHDYVVADLMPFLADAFKYVRLVFKRIVDLQSDGGK